MHESAMTRSSVTNSDVADGTIEECPYFVANTATSGKFGQCLLLKRILRADDREFSAVERDACEVCCKTDFPTPQLLNNVIASLAHSRSRTIIDRDGVAGCDARHAHEIRNFAVSEIARTTLKPRRSKKVESDPSRTPETRRRLHSCDVIVCGNTQRDLTVTAIKSVLNQRNIRVTVHLIDDGSCPIDFPDQFDIGERLVVHRMRHGRSPFLALQQLLPSLRSRYVAFQDSISVSRPNRLQRMIDLLERQGGEIGTSSVATTEGEFQLPFQFDSAKSTLPWQSLVMRRTTVIDLHLTQKSSLLNSDAFVKQVIDNGRLTSVERRVTVDIICKPDDVGKSEPGIECSASRMSNEDPLRPAVDIVLPFYNTTDFVQESLHSVLEQNSVDVVVHLIDDASTVDTSGYLEKWSQDSRIRVYRNSRNVGPYVSFNNVSRFFETEFVAIQDADDISLPHRLHAATRSLQLSSADIFAGAVEMFGDDRERAVTTKTTDAQPGFRPMPQFRFSRYPTVGQAAFVINGSVVMRTRTFTGLGGFADYGEPERNRCGLDSEFYMRAFYAGCHFFVSRDVVLKYRRHAMSSTQNNDTGWGTRKRNFARTKLLERVELYKQYEFDPRDFGGLDHYADLTQPVTPSMARQSR